MNDKLRDIPKHHIQQELCTTRPHYRQGKKLTAIKVYTINNESQHLVLYKIPKVNLHDEIKESCLKYGELQNFELITSYKVEPFTECYHAHYKKIQSARIAKRLLDNKSFYGEILHVCYAPEYETVAETRAKLLQRQKDVISRSEPGPSTLEYLNMDISDKSQPNRKRKHPALEITDDRLRNENSHKIWKDIPTYLDPRISNQNTTNSKTGFRKHFQIIETVNKGVEYGPHLPDNIDELKKTESSNTTEKVKPINTTLLPTTIIKNFKYNYNKKIVFKNKSANQN